MRIGTRALIILVPVAVLPLVGAGWSAFNVSRRALEDRTRASQVAAARSLAERVSAEIGASLRAAGLAASAMEFGQLSAEERVGALRLVFRQIEGAAAVASSGTVQPYEQQQCVGDMEQQAGEMMPGWVKIEYLAIHHVR